MTHASLIILSSLSQVIDIWSFALVGVGGRGAISPLAGLALWLVSGLGLEEPQKWQSRLSGGEDLCVQLQPLLVMNMGWPSTRDQKTDHARLLSVFLLKSILQSCHFKSLHSQCRIPRSNFMLDRKNWVAMPSPPPSVSRSKMWWWQQSLLKSLSLHDWLSTPAHSLLWPW